MPWSTALQLTGLHFIASLRYRSGLTHASANTPGVRCLCGRYMDSDDDHAMTCTSLSSNVTFLVLIRSLRFSTDMTVAEGDPSYYDAKPGRPGYFMEHKHARGRMLLSFKPSPFPPHMPRMPNRQNSHRIPPQTNSSFHSKASGLVGSVAVLAEISLRSPRKIFIFIIK